MPLKQGIPEDVYGRKLLQDLRDMAKAILLEPQCPAMFRAFLDYHIHTARPSVTCPVPKGAKVAV
jgi:hypothetical protein